VDFVPAIVAPGFFASPTVQVALIVGGVVAAACAAVGVFTVIRGQSFAGHSLSDIGTAGGSAAFLLGVGQLWGFLVVTTAAAATMELIGVQRARGRDVATGVVLGAGLGLSALLLYFDTTMSNTTGAAITVLFGSMFSLPAATVPVVAALTVVSLALTLVLYRPLLLSAVSPDIAAARRVPVRLVGVGYLLALALAVAMSSLAIGAILSTALLIGPAATGLRLASRPATAIVSAALIGVACTWLGVLLAYDSYSWPPAEHGWPVSFFVVVLILAAYLLSGLRTLPARRRTSSAATTRNITRDTSGGSAMSPADRTPEGEAPCSPVS
jgi:zinc/manganese transport system permease protein